MRELRQNADEGLPKLVQKTPDAPGQTIPETVVASMAFTMNQTSAVCLPLVSDCQKLIWVRSNEFDLQLGGEAELNKAFNRFPYLTQGQTAALAQRCALHPDQVKMWFMVQRLRYGISWDNKDISDVRKKIKLSRGMEELQNGMREEDEGESKKYKSEEKESVGKNLEKIRKEQRADEERMAGEKVKANKQLERKIKQEQPVKKEKDRVVDKDKGNTQRRWKRVTVSDKKGMKRKKQSEEAAAERTEEVETKSGEVEREKSTQSETTHFPRKRKKAKDKKRLLSMREWPALKSCVVPDEPLDPSPFPVPQSQTVPPLTAQLKRVDAIPPSTSDDLTTPVERGLETQLEARLQGDVHAGSTNHNGVVTDFRELEGLVAMLNIPRVGSPSVTQHRDYHAVQACRLPTGARSTKTSAQGEMLKAAFLHCQYPDNHGYDQLAMMTEIPRYELVQWFGDRRYQVKKGRPRWMTQEQHRKVVANIRYQQYLNDLLKTKPCAGGSDGDDKATRQMLLDMSESCGGEESVPAPPE
ncbi:hypothetical protein ABVT39_022526 [Epinephelus coioides]